MANRNNPTSQDKRNGSKGNSYFTITTFLLISLFLFSIFFFNRRSLEPSLSLYRNLLFSAGGGLDPKPPDEDSERANLPPPADPGASSGVGAETETPSEDNRSSITGNGDMNVEKSKISDGLDSNKSDDLDGASLSNDSPQANLPTATESPDGVTETLVKENQSFVPGNESGLSSPLFDVPGDSGMDSKIVDELAERLKGCDFYMGKWVRDEEYPIYKAGSCPYVDEAFDCQNNGRPDSEYLKWRWKPDGCDLPRFNATDFLVRLRGKRLMLVGDSMNRNQFESILCLLREGLPDKSRMFETHGYRITKGRGYFMFKFADYNCTVEFVRSHFLVREGIQINGQGNSNPTLSIDRIDKTANKWKWADILVFNTGHWWTHGKTARGKNYYKEGNYIYPKFDSVEAYRRALTTWAKWIKDNIKPSRQLVFYRGYSSAHFRGGDWDSGGTCNGEREPILNGTFLDNYPQKMQIVEDVIRETRVPVVLLNVTRLTNFRKDGHPSIYGKNVTERRKVSRRKQDCSHWCLPGVPDAWNELIYAQLVLQNGLSTRYS
ncbi:hypothetical protein CDL15_Pgr023919 [Punica granatum]|uniref:Uncharacterized protein n=1 Tax=Punica granatum TaxID=22663 RepID=A0A218XVT0_PUNGR|nr:hypothetical protein CDL15_Pgr023919 [Punica granatum]